MNPASFFCSLVRLVLKFLASAYVDTKQCWTCWMISQSGAIMLAKLSFLFACFGDYKGTQISLFYSWFYQAALGSAGSHILVLGRNCWLVYYDLSARKDKRNSAGIPLFVALLLLIQIQLNSSKSCAQSCFVGLTAYGVRFVLLWSMQTNNQERLFKILDILLMNCLA